MNKLTKIEKPKSPLTCSLLNFVRFIFTNGVLVTALVMLLMHLGTKNLVYLKITSLLTIGFCLFILLLVFISLVKFGAETLIIEMEVKFLNVLVYAGLITSTYLLMFLEIFN
ncbi:hypothetical protein OAO31_04310 [Gammaproteobacteria bacterium]|nr:hypothetical protein [Gammaproteobacteria bacterium]